MKFIKNDGLSMNQYLVILKEVNKVLKFIFKDIINIQKELFLILTSYNLKCICKLKAQVTEK
jgi:hypothetical protein